MTITTTYDPDADALFIQLSKRRGVGRSTVVRPGVHVEFDADGRLLSLEVLNASKIVDMDSLRTLWSGEDWMSLNEAAEVAGLSATTLRVQLNNGRIVGEKRGRDWVIARHVLDTYLDEVEQRTTGARSSPVLVPSVRAAVAAPRRGAKASKGITRAAPGRSAGKGVGAASTASSRGRGPAVNPSTSGSIVGPSTTKGLRKSK